VGGWGIFIDDVNYADSPFTYAGAPHQGTIVESSFAQADNPTCLFKTLTVSQPDTGTNANKLVLSGTATAQINGTIKDVGTYMTALEGTLPPSSTYIGNWGEFTHTILPSTSWVPVSTGQQIVVNVVISFS
jgi:hypothetical protein